MPELRAYPGVFVKELAHRPPPISAIPTAVTAFIGRAARGPLNQPLAISSWGDYQNLFGIADPSDPLADELPMAASVALFFTNGGSRALIVRVENGARPAIIQLPCASGVLQLQARDPGRWGNALRATVSPSAQGAERFTLLLEETGTSVSRHPIQSESHSDLSCSPSSSRFIKNVLAKESRLVLIEGQVPASPVQTIKHRSAQQGTDGEPITEDQISDNALRAERQGLWALENADLFNLLYIPPLAPGSDVPMRALATTTAYARTRRAVQIIDPPLSWHDTREAEKGLHTLQNAVGSEAATNAAVYFPRLRVPVSKPRQTQREQAPGGAVAGIIARTDRSRGVWKAPAGLHASFSGIRGFSSTPSAAQNHQLNALGLNVCRSFAGRGHFIWGARTLAGADRQASEWKYLSVRRTALYLQESIARGTDWAAFEVGDATLYASIRSTVENFMQLHFRQGAFQGNTVEQAFFVRCGNDTTSPQDIERGLLNIEVGFAPLKPSEFIVVRIQQKIAEHKGE